MQVLNTSVEHLGCVGRLVVVGGAVLSLMGVWLAYGHDAGLSIPLQVAAHGLIIIGPAFLKLGYIAILSSQNRVGRDGGAG